MGEIAIENVSASFDEGATFAVRSVSLEVRPGELLALVGESGSGKTTLLRLIQRLVDPDDGVIRIDGHDIRDRDPVELRRSIGYVFQGIGLFPHWTVGDNVRVVPDLLGWEDERTRRRVDELLDLTGLAADAYRERSPSELSGGERQRVGFARALASSPTILLLDEPFGALDPVTRDKLQRDFARIHRELELTAILVTHDMTEALLLADRVAVMKDAAVLQVASPREMLRSPATPYVEQLLTTPKQQANDVERLFHTARSETEGTES